MTSHPGKSSFVHSLFFCLLVCCLSIHLPSAFADSSQKNTAQLSNDELVLLIHYKSTDKLATFIQQSNQAQLNVPVTFPYTTHSASLLSLLIQYTGDKALIAQLLEKGAKPEGLIDEEIVPLTAALEMGHTDIALLLLGAGANPSRIISSGPDDIKASLFYRALMKQDLHAFTKQAIAFKPELTYTDGMREHKVLSYLALALQNNHPHEVIDYLLAQGEDVNKVIDKNEGSPYRTLLNKTQYLRANTPKEIKSANNRLASFNLLLDKVNNLFPSFKYKCYDPLFIVQDDLKTLNRLLQKGLNPNKNICFNKNHLSTAAYLGYIPIFEKLLDAGGIIKKDTMLTMIDSKYSNDLLQWVWQHKAKVFTQCKISHCNEYLQKFISKDKITSDFLPIVDELLTRLSGKTNLLNDSLKVAIKENNISLANRLMKAGARPLDKKCDCQQFLWAVAYKAEAKDWLITQKVNPFIGKKPFHETINLERVSAQQLNALLNMAPKSALTKNNLHHWFTLIFSPMGGGSDLNYITLKQHLATFSKHEVTLNNVLDKTGKAYLPTLINTLIKNQDSHHGDIKLLWLLAQGARPSSENQPKTINNAYLQAALKRAADEGENPILAVQHQTQALSQLITRRIDYDPVRLINALVTAKLLPLNHTIGLKTADELKAEDISYLRYTCHYASHSTIWAWLTEELPSSSRVEAGSEEFKKMFLACTRDELALETNMQAPPAQKRKDWFEAAFYEVNFSILELDSVSLPSPSQVLNTQEITAIQTLLAAQLQKVNASNADELTQTLTLLTQAGGKLPDNALKTFLSGSHLDIDNPPIFAEIIKQLVSAGTDPTTPLWGTGYNFMEHLPLNDQGQALYDELYETLTWMQKIRLWDGIPARLIASAQQEKLSRDNMYRVGWTMLSLGIAIIATVIAILLTLIVYLWRNRKKPSHKIIVPTWPLQSAFWAGATLLVLAICNFLYLDSVFQKILSVNDEGFSSYSELFQWSLWMKIWLLVITAQLISLLIIIKRVLQQQYHLLTMFTSVLFFLYSLSLPIWMAAVADYHDYISFPVSLIL